MLGISQPAPLTVRLSGIRRERCLDRNAVASIRLALLQYSTLWDLTVSYVAPKGNQQLARKSHDCDPANSAALSSDSLLEPAGQCAVGLIAYPQPGQFNHDMA